MRQNFLYLLLFGLTMVSFNSRATIITAVSTGNWNSPFTWNGTIPQCGDTVIIPAGIIVTITENVDLNTGDPLCPFFRLTIAGSLRFNNGRKLHLASGACMTVETGGTIGQSVKGGGASESIYLGENRVWQASEGMLHGFQSYGCAILLPVTLINFSLSILNNQVELNFATASENNLDHFLIETSRDGSYWQTIERLKGNGNSVALNSYKYTDKNPFNGTSYYRLKSVDFDGSVHTLNILSCEFYSSKFLMYPIPVNKQMFLEGENLDQSTINIVNSIGEPIEVEMNLLGDKLNFNFEDIKNGIYFVSIRNVKVNKTERIVVAHK
jgi:hypothetical protein